MAELAQSHGVHDGCRPGAPSPVEALMAHPGMGIRLALFNANEVAVTNDEMSVLDELD